MKYLHSVVATNQINRKNMVIKDSCLEDMARQINEQGGTPQLHSHDWTRLIGWTTKAWTEREGIHLKLVTETEVPETECEKQAIYQKFEQRRYSIYNKIISPFFSERIDNTILTYDMSCVFLFGKDILLDTYPELKNKIDKDGLLYLKNPLFVGDGVIEYKKHPGF